ncbi:MAG TPA: DivIVA domain-containing protein [Cytophagaceae bacterium]|jgi:cell division initiation protein|nr:DivIVA domain-containing protein [Cytophagaceae bacterium]
MKITPLEIRQKDFEKTFRGYDKEEVDAFLQALSQEWERAQDEMKELRKRLEQSETEASRLREVEHSLFKTLKTAEDTGASLVEQANKSAELHIREAQMNSEAILNESRSKARAIVEEAELQSRRYFSELQEDVQKLQREFQEIQNMRDNFLHDIQSIASDFTQKAQRYTEKSVSSSIEKKVKQIKSLSENGKKIESSKHLDETATVKKEEENNSNTSEVKSIPSSKNREGTSFFDSI